jgi:hypothetical protein
MAMIGINVNYVMTVLNQYMTLYNYRELGEEGEAHDSTSFNHEADEAHAV